MLSEHIENTLKDCMSYSKFVSKICLVLAIKFGIHFEISVMLKTLCGLQASKIEKT